MADSVGGDILVVLTLNYREEVDGDDDDMDEVAWAMVGMQWVGYGGSSEYNSARLHVTVRNYPLLYVTAPLL